MSEFEIREYRSLSGERPFRQWIAGLKDAAARARIRVRIDRLLQGNVGDARPVGHGVFELRFHFGPGLRVYAGRLGRIIVLLGGGNKATQERDIVQARRRWEDYRRAHETEMG